MTERPDEASRTDDPDAIAPDEVLAPAADDVAPEPDEADASRGPEEPTDDPPGDEESTGGEPTEGDSTGEQVTGEESTGEESTEDAPADGEAVQAEPVEDDAPMAESPDGAIPADEPADDAAELTDDAEPDTAGPADDAWPSEPEHVDDATETADLEADSPEPEPERERERERPEPEPEPEPDSEPEPEPAPALEAPVPDPDATVVMPPLEPEPEAAAEPAAESEPALEPEVAAEPAAEPEQEPAAEEQPTEVLPLVEPTPEPAPAEPAVAERAADAPADDAPRRRSRRGLVVAGVVAVVLVVLAGAYVGALWLWSDRVPPGTTVAGVDIGGLAADDAVAELSEALHAATTDDLEVAAGDLRTAIPPADAGLTFDARATVEQVTGFGLEPSRLWAQLFGASAVEPVSDVDREALEGALDDVVEALSVAPVDGTITFVDGVPQPTPATQGVTLDIPASVELIATSWLTQARPIELPTEVDPPAVDDADVQEALATLAEPLRSAPVRVEVGGQVAELPVAVLTEAASFVPADGELVLQMNGEQLVEAVLVRTTDLLTAATEPRFDFDANGPVIVPGVPGTTIDPAELATAVAEAGTTAGDRTARVGLVESDPAQSVAELEALGVSQVVSEFSTPLTSEPRRTRNIANAASKLDGMLIRPGEEFNLAEAIGPIDAANGYVDAGAIVNGQHTDAMGGGLSQISTTVYNAAFFAGYELVEHTPHSEWFRRYPEGREATLFTPTINMRWRNNTPYGALLQAWVDGGRVHVRVWSTPYFTVETTTSGRSNVVQPTTVYSQSPTCAPQSAGNPGFTVTVTRTVLLDGVQQDHESWTVRYRPQNAVVCGPPPGEAPPAG